jgi:flagellar protein FliO/FliZ
MKPKPSLFAVAAACASLLLASPSAFAAAGEKTPLNLKDVPGAPAHSGGGSLVRTIVGLAVVIGVIYGLYWILKQVKSSREEKASGQGLSSLATLPLGPSRSLQLVRAGRELVLVGVSEHGVTPVRTYSEEEAEAAGLLGLEAEALGADQGGGPGGGGGVFADVVDELRRRTVRR